MKPGNQTLMSECQFRQKGSVDKGVAEMSDAGCSPSP